MPAYIYFINIKIKSLFNTRARFERAEGTHTRCVPLNEKYSYSDIPFQTGVRNLSALFKINFFMLQNNENMSNFTMRRATVCPKSVPVCPVPHTVKLRYIGIGRVPAI